MPYFHHFMAESIGNSNKCCPQVKSSNGLIKTVKSGYLLLFKKKMFCKAWKEAYVVLYEDSSLVWFRDRDRVEAEGNIYLKDAPEMLAAGQWTSRVPTRPDFPTGCDFKLSIAIGSRNRDKVIWFLCKSETELIEWMSAINYTLPLPPPPPEELRDTRRSDHYQKDTKGYLIQAQATPSRLMAQLYHQPSAPELLNGKMSKSLLLRQLQQNDRSYSTGKMNHLDNGLSDSNKSILKRSTSFKESKVFGNRDVTPAFMVAAIMTQWNANADCWDWGMGWGWAGWSASYCDTCALEHAAIAAHVASSAGHNQTANFSETLIDPKPSGMSHSFRSTHDLYVYDDDNEVTELGETDVGCDFGDFGGF